MGAPVELAAGRCRRGIRMAVSLRHSCFGPRHPLYRRLQEIERRLVELHHIARYETELEVTTEQWQDLSQLMRQLRLIRREVA